MSSEETLSKTDFFLREIPNVKTSNNSLPIKRYAVKEELQFLRINEDVQDQIMDTLLFIHGPDFKLKDSSDYKDVKTNLAKKFWVGQGSLVIKGVHDYSKTNYPEAEEDRLKQFALLRLESYGFHKNHCIEALNMCEQNVEDALYLLYKKYFSSDEEKEIEHNLSEKELLEQRSDEKSSLESIYEDAFSEKVQNSVWILTVKLDYLIKLFHNKENSIKAQKNLNNKPKKEKCKNLIRGNCKYGNKCRFSHESDTAPKDPNAHLTEFIFELEIRFPNNTKYPYEPPLILLKTNAVLPPLVNLHICYRLYKEAKIMAEDGIPSIYTITELLLNEEEITAHLKTDIQFINANERLFPAPNEFIVKIKRPSHYIKGITNKSNKKTLSWKEIKENDEKIAKKYKEQLNNKKYIEMLQSRRTLPAWALMNDILNTIQKSQVVVISGETGCGKSTQVPQYILDDWLVNFENDKKHIEIVCTQPRRISAIGVAERVADERCARIGNSVGYQIRLESKVSAFTRLTFCTTGILLRRLESEPTLSNVTHIIVDEVHERSEESDFLLLILKEILPFRPDLKVILMSATLNAQLFSDYFGEIPILDIPGRTFPVEQYFLEDIFEATGYVLEPGSEYARKIKNRDLEEDEMSEYCLTKAYKPKDSIKEENLKYTQIFARYRDYSQRTCRNITLMDADVINNELIENILTWIVSGDHNYPRTGTILIFLPGIAEITNLYDQLNVHPEFGPRHRKFVIFPLHSSLTSEEQAQIFRKPKNGERKIVLSTNLAETSVTIDDCVFVIDSGKMKEKHFDPNRNMESLETVWVTRANALQRKGRAGRVMPGVCFHLYTSNRFNHQMLPQPIPEIHRIPLEQLILNIKVLQNFEDRDVGQVMSAFIEPPVKENVETAILRLQDVGALDKTNELTPLGHHLAALPVDVRIGKLMLYGAIFSCVDSALTMAACLSYKSPFVTPFLKKDEANAKKKNFAVGKSDQMTALIAYKKWLSTFKKNSLAGRNFANENYLSHRTLLTIADIKHQFLEFLVDIGFIAVNLGGRRATGQDDVLAITGSEFNQNGENLNVMSAILCAALYPNVIKVLLPPKSFVKFAGGAIPKENDAKDLKFQTVQENVFMHPSSVNYTISNFHSPYLVYQEKVRTSKVFFRDCTMVPIIPLVLFSGFDLDINVHNFCTFISLERGWIMFQVEDHKIAEMMKMIKLELFALLEEKIKDPLLNLMHDERGERIISTILNLIK